MLIQQEVTLVFMLTLNEPNDPNHLYVSYGGGVYDKRWWAPAIIESPQLGLVYPDAGGYIRPQYGRVRFSSDLFGKTPPEILEFQAMWDRVPILKGTMWLSEVRQESCAYELWEKQFDIDLLEMGLDVSGEEVEVPICFGEVSHFSPLRTEPSNEYKYYWSGIVPGSATIYDDGVDITANVTDNGDGTFNLSVVPVGTVTISGTGEMEDLVSIFTWACQRIGCTFDSTYALAYAIDHVVNSQQGLIDFLDRVAGYCAHFFAFNFDYSELKLVWRKATTKEHELSEFEVSDDPVAKPGPIKRLESYWTLQEPVVDSAGKRIESLDFEVIYETGNAIGEVLTVEPFNQTETRIKGHLQELAEVWAMKRPTINTPIEDLLFTDIYKLWDSIAERDISFMVSGVAYDFLRERMTLTGQGDYV